MCLKSKDKPIFHFRRCYTVYKIVCVGPCNNEVYLNDKDTMTCQNYQSSWINWKPSVVIMPTLSSLMGPEVVVTTTCDAIRDDKIGILRTLCSECLWNVTAKNRCYTIIKIQYHCYLSANESNTCTHTLISMNYKMFSVARYQSHQHHG